MFVGDLTRALIGVLSMNRRACPRANYGLGKTKQKVDKKPSNFCLKIFLVVT